MVKRQTTGTVFSKVTVDGQLKFVGSHNQCCAYVIREVPANITQDAKDRVDIQPIESAYPYAYTEAGNTVVEHIRATADLMDEFRKARARFVVTGNPYEFRGRAFELITDVIRLKGQRVKDQLIREVFTGLCASVGMKTTIY